MGQGCAGARASQAALYSFTLHPGRASLVSKSTRGLCSVAFGRELCVEARLLATSHGAAAWVGIEVRSGRPPNIGAWFKSVPDRSSPSQRLGPGARGGWGVLRCDPILLARALDGVWGAASNVSVGVDRVQPKMGGPKGQCQIWPTDPNTQNWGCVACACKCGFGSAASTFPAYVYLGRRAAIVRWQAQHTGRRSNTRRPKPAGRLHPVAMARYRR